jgi:hypothetical protein
MPLLSSLSLNSSLEIHVSRSDPAPGRLSNFSGKLLPTYRQSNGEDHLREQPSLFGNTQVTGYVGVPLVSDLLFSPPTHSYPAALGTPYALKPVEEDFGGAHSIRVHRPGAVDTQSPASAPHKLPAWLSNTSVLLRWRENPHDRPIVHGMPLHDT